MTLLPFYFGRQINYTVLEILSILEENPPQQPTDIILFPTDESGNMSDEDNRNEDDDIKNVNHLGKGILSQMGELVTHHNEDNLEENDNKYQEAHQGLLFLNHNQDHLLQIHCALTLEGIK